MSARRLPRVTTLSDAEVWGVVHANTGLCHKVAREFAGRGLDRDDLVQEGLFGLRNAVELFDPTRTGPDGKPVAFSSYAIAAIRKTVRRAVETKGRMIRTPLRTGQDVAKIRAGKLDPDTLGRRRRRCCADALAVGSVGSLDVILDEGHERRHAGAAGAESRPDRIDPAEWAEALAAADRLPPREREVIRLRFGLGDGPPRTLRQVGALIGLTYERVRQLEHRALRRLRAELVPA